MTSAAHRGHNSCYTSLRDVIPFLYGGLTKRLGPLRLEWNNTPRIVRHKFYNARAKKGHFKEEAKQIHEIALALEKDMQEMQRARSESWRMEPPKDLTNPLAIQRPVFWRRKALQDIWLDVHSDTDSDLTSVSGENGSSVRTRADSTNSHIALKTTLPNKDDVRGYENTNFNYDEVRQGQECFVSAYGRKGKEIGEFEDAKDVACLDGGHLLVSDMVLGRLQKFSNKASIVAVLATEEITHPWGITVTKDSHIAITLCTQRCVKILTEDGEFVRTFGEGFFVRPSGIASDDAGRLIVCDANSNKVSLFTVEGSFITFLGNPDIKEECFSKPRYACVSVNGDVIISDSGNHKIKIFNNNGEFVKSFGSFGKSDGQFKCPYGVCTNKLGEIFVSDHYNSRISMFSRDGVFIRHLVTHDQGLGHPQGITISQDMHLFITHGLLKATEVLEFKLTNVQSVYIANDLVELITHV